MSAAPCPSCRPATHQHCEIGAKLFRTYQADKRAHWAAAARSPDTHTTDMARKHAETSRDKYHAHIRLGWCPEPEATEVAS